MAGRGGGSPLALVVEIRKKWKKIKDGGNGERRRGEVGWTGGWWGGQGDGRWRRGREGQCFVKVELKGEKVEGTQKDTRAMKKGKRRNE